MDLKKQVKYPNLVSEMARRGESQKTIAHLLGVTQATISRKLSGKIDWTMKEINAICEYYGMGFCQLFK